MCQYREKKSMTTMTTAPVPDFGGEPRGLRANWWLKAIDRTPDPKQKTKMTTDRALELAEAVFHDLRNGQAPYLPRADILEVLRVLGELRERTHR